MTKNNTLKENYIYQGDALNVLKTLPGGSVNMAITSPPYYALRDYGVDGQIGLEETFNDYLDNLLAVFKETKRVLKKTGTLWVNISDTYGGSGMGTWKSNSSPTGKQVYTIPYGKNMSARLRNSKYQKSLLTIPFRFAIRMVDEQGWILRNTIIWHKPNCMPSSVKDRFTVDFEYLFFFSKNKKYYFEQQFERYAPASDVRYRQALRANRSYNTKKPYENNTPYSKYKKNVGSVKRRGDDADGLVVGGKNEGRNKRTVWKIPTKPFKEAHFAVYPEKLIETPIKAGCPKNGVVLDPFMGSGTTAIVARKLGCNYIGIELNKKYIKIAEKRLQQKFLI